MTKTLAELREEINAMGLPNPVDVLAAELDQIDAFIKLHVKPIEDRREEIKGQLTAMYLASKGVNSKSDLPKEKGTIQGELFTVSVSVGHRELVISKSEIDKKLGDGFCKSNALLNTSVSISFDPVRKS